MNLQGNKGATTFKKLYNPYDPSFQQQSFQTLIPHNSTHEQTSLTPVNHPLAHFDFNQYQQQAGVNISQTLDTQPTFTLINPRNSLPNLH
jgi:hypothetical protein